MEGGTRGDPDIDPLAPALRLLGLAGCLPDVPDPLRQDGSQSIHFAETAEGAEFVVQREVQLDSVRLVAGQQLLENPEPLPAHLGVQKVEPPGAEHASQQLRPGVIVLAHVELGVVEYEFGFSAVAPLRLLTSSDDADRTGGNEPDPFLVASLGQDAHGVVAVGHQLLEIARGTVEDGVHPHVHVVAPLGGHLAAVLDGAALQSRRIEQGVHPAVDQLVYGIGQIGSLQRRGELIESGIVAPVVIEEDPGFARFPLPRGSRVLLCGRGRDRRGQGGAGGRHAQSLQEMSALHGWSWPDRFPGTGAVKATPPFLRQYSMGRGSKCRCSRYSMEQSTSWISNSRSTSGSFSSRVTFTTFSPGVG